MISIVASRFRRVEWIGVVADVLRAIEHSKRESGKEIARAEIAGDRANSEPGLIWNTSDYGGTSVNFLGSGKRRPTAERSSPNSRSGVRAVRNCRGTPCRHIVYAIPAICDRWCP